MFMSAYTGRFAPSPTGPLHAGSVVAALASWLDARAQGGTWLVRIEDIDATRCKPEHAQTILQQLDRLGLNPDQPPVWQSRRLDLYKAALKHLIEQDAAYGCSCSRKDIEATWVSQGTHRPRHGELVYPGTCRQGTSNRSIRAWRFKCPAGPASLVTWQDRRLGQQTQDVAHEVGDFVVRRADGLFAYQLAVVVDDADQGITHVVRGQDLADNTARQILLQRALALPPLTYLHTPLVLGSDGEKLSKQNGAQAIDLDQPVQVLQQAALTLGLTGSNQLTLADWLAQAVTQWRDLYNPAL
jgi:glutamyl-Q tRNA(Asp) synthetase